MRRRDRAAISAPSTSRCAIYTRKSSEEGLEQEFNSLDAQREACEAYIRSQKRDGWTRPLRTCTMTAASLAAPWSGQRSSAARRHRRPVRSIRRRLQGRPADPLALRDFAKIVDVFDAKGVSFVSVTQQFNTTTSMGRLTLNMLLSFAQFEREVTGERIRDKIAASKRRACGWAAFRRSATTSRIASSSSTKPRLTPFVTSSAATRS